MRALLSSRWVFIPVFLAAQAAVVHWAAAGERPPAPPDLSKIPREIAGWNQVADSALDPEVLRELHADRLLNRMYSNPANHGYANLFLAWFGSQRGGAQPHSPKVCLPGSGWITESSGQETLATTAGSIAVNRMIVSNQGQRAVVLYWYQTPRRVMASEWEAKLWVIADSLRFHRTDVELVRIVEWWNGSEGATLSQVSDFARNVYPNVTNY